jgi:hypothetical protein
MTVISPTTLQVMTSKGSSKTNINSLLLKSFITNKDKTKLALPNLIISKRLQDRRSIHLFILTQPHNIPKFYKDRRLEMTSTAGENTWLINWITAIWAHRCITTTIKDKIMLNNMDPMMKTKKTSKKGKTKAADQKAQTAIIHKVKSLHHHTLKTTLFIQPQKHLDFTSTNRAEEMPDFKMDSRFITRLITYELFTSFYY